jgi:hypothetical protein
VYLDGDECTATSENGETANKCKDGGLRRSVANRFSVGCKKLRTLRKLYVLGCELSFVDPFHAHPVIFVKSIPYG